MMKQTMQRISVFTLMAIALGTSPSMGFDQEEFERLKSTLVCVDCDLSGVDLTNSFLAGATLFRSNLSGANLTNADLFGADLTDVNLTGANLSGANLGNSRLVDANLTDADISGAVFDSAIICKTTMPDGKIDNSGCGLAE